MTEAADAEGAAEARTAGRAEALERHEEEAQGPEGIGRAEALEREHQHCLAIEKLEAEHQQVSVSVWVGGREGKEVSLCEVV